MTQAPIIKIGNDIPIAFTIYEDGIIKDMSACTIVSWGIGTEGCNKNSKMYVELRGGTNPYSIIVRDTFGSTLGNYWVRVDFEVNGERRSIDGFAFVLAEHSATLGIAPNNPIQVSGTTNIITTIDGAVRYDIIQELTSEEQNRARNNINAGTSNFSGDYNDLSNKPNIYTQSQTDALLDSKLNTDAPIVSETVIKANCPDADLFYDLSADITLTSSKEEALQFFENITAGYKPFVELYIDDSLFCKVPLIYNNGSYIGQFQYSNVISVYKDDVIGASIVIYNASAFHSRTIWISISEEGEPSFLDYNRVTASELVKEYDTCRMAGTFSPVVQIDTKPEKYKSNILPLYDVRTISDTNIKLHFPILNHDTYAHQMIELDVNSTTSTITASFINWVFANAEGIVTSAGANGDIQTQETFNTTTLTSLALKVDKTAVKQTTGTSETDVMSQKAVTDEIAQLAGDIVQVETDLNTDVFEIDKKINTSTVLFNESYTIIGSGFSRYIPITPESSPFTLIIQPSTTSINGVTYRIYFNRDINRVIYTNVNEVKEITIPIDVTELWIFSNDPDFIGDDIFHIIGSRKNISSLQSQINNLTENTQTQIDAVNLSIGSVDESISGYKEILNSETVISTTLNKTVILTESGESRKLKIRLNSVGFIYGILFQIDDITVDYLETNRDYYFTLGGNQIKLWFYKTGLTIGTSVTGIVSIYNPNVINMDYILETLNSDVVAEHDIKKRSVNFYNGNTVCGFAVSTSPNITLSNSFRTTDLIPVKLGEIWFCGYNNGTYPSYNVAYSIVECDSTGAIIIRGSNLPTTAYKVTDSNVKYIRYSFSLMSGKEPTDIIIYKYNSPESNSKKRVADDSVATQPYEPYGYLDEIDSTKVLIASGYTGKYGVSFGDSITHYSFYPYVIEKITGAKMFNAGIGGTRIAKHMNGDGLSWDAYSMYRFADSIVTGDWTLQINALTDIHVQSTFPSLGVDKITPLTQIDWTKINFITIAFGTNDFTSGNPIGTNLDTTGESIKGAVNYTITTILGKYPHLRIVFVLPLWRVWFTDGTMQTILDDSDTHLVNGNTLLQIRDAIKEVAQLYNVECVDMYKEMGLNRLTWATYLSDGTHPSYNGSREIGHRISSYLLAH